jgi:ankyrin repeat protein
MLSMVVLLSPNDRAEFTTTLSRTATRELQEKTKDKKAECFERIFKEDCFKGLPDTPAKFSLACHGHGTKEGLGEKVLSPEQFVQQLKVFGCPFHRIDSIYLFSCNIGLTANNTSYAQRVAELIQAEYPHVIIKTFTNWGIRSELSAMYLALPHSNVSCTIVGITKEKYTDYLEDSRVGLKEGLDHIHSTLSYKTRLLINQIIELTNDIQNHDKIAIVKESVIALKLIFSKHFVNPEFISTLNDLLSQCNGIDSKKIDFENNLLPTQILQNTTVILSRHLREFANINYREILSPASEYFISKHQKTFHSYENATQALDTNPNYILSKHTLNIRKKMDEKRQLVWAHNNERIAETHMKLPLNKKKLKRLLSLKRQLERGKNDLTKYLAKIRPSTPRPSTHLPRPNQQLAQAARLGLKTEMKHLVQAGAYLEAPDQIEIFHDAIIHDDPFLAHYCFCLMDQKLKKELAAEFSKKDIATQIQFMKMHPDVIYFFDALQLKHFLTERDDKGLTLTFHAVKDGDAKILVNLTYARVNVSEELNTIKFPFNRTIAHDIVTKKNSAAIPLLQRYGDPDLLFRPDDQGLTPIMYAISSSDPIMLRSFIAAHINVTYHLGRPIPPDDINVAHLLVLKNKPHAINWLIELDRNDLLTTPDKKGLTPVMYAVREAKPDMMKAFVDAKVNVADELKKTFPPFDRTIAHQVILRDDPAAFKLFMQYGDKELLYRPDKRGHTPVMLAVLANKTNMLAEFKKYDIEIPTQNHAPPINPAPS